MEVACRLLGEEARWHRKGKQERGVFAAGIYAGDTQEAALYRPNTKETSGRGGGALIVGVEERGSLLKDPDVPVRTKINQCISCIPALV